MSVCLSVCLCVLYAFKGHSSDCPQILHEYSMAAGEKDREVFLNSNAFRGRQRSVQMPFVRLLPNFAPHISFTLAFSANFPNAIRPIAPKFFYSCRKT